MFWLEQALAQYGSRLRAICVLLCCFAAACTPKLAGLCASDSDCKAGESCSSGGLCLRAAGNGNPTDGGDGNPTDGGNGNPTDGGNGNPTDGGNGNTTDGGGTTPASTIDLLTPQNGAVLPGHFHVSAQTDSDNLVTDVDFLVINAVSGAALGQLTVTSPSGTVWSGDLTLSVVSYSGSAKLNAVAHRTGLADLSSSSASLVVDQAAPTLLSWDAGGWVARDAGLTVAAAISDNLSGVASAELDLPDGGTYTAALTGSVSATAVFHLAAADVGAPGATAMVPFSLAATDVVGNRAALPDASVLLVDDEAPALVVPTFGAAAWYTGAIDFVANIDDHGGSGIVVATLFLGDAGIAGQPDGGGSYFFHANLNQVLPGTESAVSFQIVAADAVGNQSDGGGAIQVDDVPPVVSAAQIDTAFDGVDGASQGWFQGPTVAPSAGPVQVSAVFSDTNLVTSGAGAPVAIVGASSYAGTLASGRWTFPIPRAVGLNASAAVAVAFDAQDLAGNHPVSPPGLSLQFDDVTAASFQPSIAADATWYKRSASITPAVAVTLPVVPRSGVVSVILVVAGQTPISCGSSSSSSYSCALPSTYAPAGGSGPLSFTVTATSVSGVVSQSTGARNFDDVPPVVSGVKIDTAFDGVDGSSQGWFQGPTAAPSAGAIQVSAVVTDTNLVTSGAGAPVAKVGANSYPGTLASGRWTFQIPRSAGLNASAAVAVGFDAQDLAGNHPVSPPGLSLQFDDVPAASFKPSIAADSTWYGRSATVAASVGVTLPGLPRSGVKSVTLAVAGQASVSCTGGSTSFSCALPSTYAPSSTEAALSFAVTVTSVTGVAPSSAGSRNFDDVAPVVGALTVSYPAAVSGPLGWGHDGAHFTLLDSFPTTPFFTAYDCGAGLSTATLNLSPVLSTSATSLTDSGARHACANGNNAVIYNLNASANLGTSAAGSFTGIGNTLTLTASATDAASGVSHTGGNLLGIAVTRGLWKTSPGTVSFLALGPRLFAAGAGGMFAFDPVTAAQTTWSSISTNLDGIAPNAGTPAVIYDNANSEFFAGNAATGSSNFGLCSASGTSSGAVELAGVSSAVVASSTPKTVTGCNCANCTSLGDPCNSISCYDDGGTGCRIATYNNFTNTLTLSGTTVSCALGGTVQAALCAGAPSGPGSLSLRISSASPATLFVGSNGSAWVAANAAGATLNTYGAALSSPGWPLVDGSASPIVYLPGVFGATNRIDAVQLTSGGFGSMLYSLVGFAGSINDMSLSSGGMLFVVSGNTVYAIITDSTGGLSNQASAWPSQCHDPCRSSIAGYACPY